MNHSPAFTAASTALAEELGQFRREGDSWFFPSETDKEEPEHRVDLLADSLFCTCRGFIGWRHCKHSNRIEEALTMTDHRALVERPADLPGLPTHPSPQSLARRLAEMVQERGLVAAFFHDVMEEGFDYGIIPGTEKPTLFKPGAEKLAELYGYAPVVKDRQEITDYNTGFYRVVITMALVGKDSGVTAAEGVGECNTREARYFYRWVGLSRIPKGIDPASLKQEERQFTEKTTGQKRKWIAYRLENDDLFTLWNSVLKMAKKRALVDATLAATRSSGIFGRSAKDVQEWIEAEYTDITELADDDDPDVAPIPQPPTAKPAAAHSWGKAGVGAGTYSSGEAPQPPAPAAPSPQTGGTSVTMTDIHALLRELRRTATPKDYGGIYREFCAKFGVSTSGLNWQDAPKEQYPEMVAWLQKAKASIEPELPEEAAAIVFDRASRSARTPEGSL